MQHDLEKDIKFYKLYYFSYCFAYGSFFPILGLYLKTAAGLDIGRVGTIMSLAPLISLICQPLWGILNQSLGVSRIAIQIGLALTSLLQVAILFTREYSLLLPLYTVFCIFNCCFFPFHDGITTIFAKKVNKQFGEIRVWGTIGWTLAALITGYIAQYLGYKIVGLMALAVYWAAITCFSKTQKIDVRKKEKKEKSSFISLLKNKNFMTLIGIVALGNGSVVVSDYFMNIKLYSLGALESQIGFANSFSVFTEIFAMIFTTKVLQKRFQPSKVLAMGITAMAAYLLLLAVSGNYIFAFGVTGFRGVAMGLYIPTVILCASHLVKTEEIPSAVMLYTSFGTGLYPFIMGNLAGHLQKFISMDIVLFTLGMTAVASFTMALKLNKNMSISSEEQLTNA